MTPCAHPDGPDDEGFCLLCGDYVSTDPPTEAIVTATATAVTTVTRSPQRTITPAREPGRISEWHGVVSDSALVALPSVEDVAPASRVLTNPVVPEQNRVCGECGEDIGRSIQDEPGVVSGTCWNCSTPYSFEPNLRRGDLVGHYEIVDALGQGGVGWVYLAMDTHLDNRYVAIKALINEHNPSTVAAVVNEKKFLTTFDHDNVVRIFDFVAENPTGYIVMEYVGGKSLYEIKQLARANMRPLPVADVVRYGLQILDALEYVHGRQYVYCDLKPDNVIHRRQRIKLIDMGAVCPIGFRGDVWGTPFYSAPAEERKTRGMQVDMDLYSLGRTLNELLTATVEERLAARGALASGVDSLRLTLERATSADWHHRFPTAADMREQLDGVLRQLIAARGAELAPIRSARFAASAELLDDGLGRPPTLELWTGAPASDAVLRTGVLADGRPAPPLVAARLAGTEPDRTDRAAAFLAGMTTADPDRLLTELRRFGEPTQEIELARCRVYLALRDYEAAARCLTDAERLTGRADWQVLWHRALLAVHQQRITDAEELFTKVRADLPGELAPRLALGYCAEHRGDHELAAEHYEVVWHTDRAAASAAFGLARTRLAIGDRDGAVRILDEVRPVSRHYDAAQIAAVRVRTGRLGDNGVGDGCPRPADVVDAARRLESAAHTSTRLAAVVRQAALDLLRANGDPNDLYPGDVLGSPVTERELRLRLESSFRQLAEEADDDDQYGTLVDLANTVRPRTWW
ncbi:MAG TPA: tetratricopeptide repeat protein [Pseudonocardiaceae bacterium]|nr:tetratricopeptide repeat protein [Pseudonocardiaceae bacterium]